MADLKSFGKRIRVTGRVVEENGNLLKRKVATAVDASLVLSTPVDTGRARSNWQPELNKPAEGESDPMPASEALARAEAVIQAAQPDDEIHLTNNLPYIGKLNEGWSAQAPANFVETAVIDGANQVRGARITIKGGVK